MENSGTEETKGIANCIKLIEDQKVREFVIRCLLAAPKYFWKIAASSSGNYHPIASLVKGGLARHTIIAVNYGISLCEKNSLTTLDRDIIIAALLLHDTCKAGVENIENHSYYSQHAYLPRNYYKAIANQYLPEKSNIIFDLIDSHMGQWSEIPEKIPETKEQKITHYADYLASRKNQPILNYADQITPLKTYDSSIIL